MGPGSVRAQSLQQHAFAHWCVDEGMGEGEFSEARENLANQADQSVFQRYAGDAMSVSGGYAAAAESNELKLKVVKAVQPHE